MITFFGNVAIIGSNRFVQRLEISSTRNSRISMMLPFCARLSTAKLNQGQSIYKKLGCSSNTKIVLIYYGLSRLTKCSH